MKLTDMDYIRDALSNAKHSNLTLDDLIFIAEHALDPKRFNSAVNMLGLTADIPTQPSAEG